MEFDEARNQWWTLPGASEKTLLIGGHLDSVPNGGWLDGALKWSPARRCCGGSPKRAAAHHGPARQLGRRGGRALRSLAVRLERGGRLDGDQDELRQRKDADGIVAARRDRRARRRPRQGDGRTPAARERRRLPRAAHRARAGARVAWTFRWASSSAPSGSSATRSRSAARPRTRGRRPMDKRRDALAAARSARARDLRHRRAARRRLHDGQRRHEARHRHLGRRDRRVPARPAQPRRRQARHDARATPKRRRDVSRGATTSRSTGSASGNRADPVRRRADRARRRVGPRGRRHVAPAAERPAPRRRRGLASRAFRR